MIEQWIALFIVVGAGVYIGYAIGVAKRKWWRGPKPPSDDQQPDDKPTPTEIADRIIDRLFTDERWMSQAQGIREFVGEAIKANLPGKAEFEASVAAMVRTAAEALQVARRKSGKRNRRGKV